MIIPPPPRTIGRFPPAMSADEDIFFGYATTQIPFFPDFLPSLLRCWFVPGLSYCQAFPIVAA